MRLGFVLTLLMASLRLEPVQAYSICGEPMVIFYANGVKNEPKDAAKSLRYLRNNVVRGLSETEIKPSRVSFNLAYNFSKL